MILFTKDNIRELVRTGRTKAIFQNDLLGDMEMEILMENVSPFECMVAACVGFKDSDETQQRIRDEEANRNTGEDCVLCGQPGYKCDGHTSEEYDAHDTLVDENRVEAEEITRKG